MMHRNDRSHINSHINSSRYEDDRLGDGAQAENMDDYSMIPVDAIVSTLTEAAHRYQAIPQTRDALFRICNDLRAVREHLCVQSTRSMSRSERSEALCCPISTEDHQPTCGIQPTPYRSTQPGFQGRIAQAGEQPEARSPHARMRPPCSTMPRNLHQ